MFIKKIIKNNILYINIKVLVYIIVSIILLNSCTVQYKVVGKFEDFNEVFKGQISHDLMHGIGHIEVESSPSKRTCTGSSRVTFIPASNYLIPGYCGGQKGTANLICSITGEVLATWEATSCTSGFGTGFDKSGRKFAFTFGLNEDEANAKIASLTDEVKNKPKIEIYEPEKVRKEKGYNTGTGFVISKDGYMITNYHVINESNNISVVLKDKEIKAKLITKDKANDIAVIKINVDEEFIPIPISKTTLLNIGDEVFTLGYPLVDVQGKNLKATFGRINSKTGLADDIRLLQIDVPIQPGNSGGPLLNSKGDVVGVVTSTLDQIIVLYKKGSLPQNVNYAVKSDYILPIIENIKVTKSANQDKKIPEIIKSYSSSVMMIIAR
jgi:S1-C subfamily serine protease